MSQMVTPGTAAACDLKKSFLMLDMSRFSLAAVAASIA
jgi:hypothetical protein